ncbi:hypothetical protein [Mesorhizobium sp. YR577]|uniref:hypothetical protein n=1 Tax=Mesorhizobium sp. YR577 TaxID=1884373 RepID=UPI0015879120|nr:hypothetical protein [Mesorhizobium sp. YR577]
MTIDMPASEVVMKYEVLIAAFAMVSPTAASAGEALDTVKPFYDHIGTELDSAERGRFVDPAKSVLDARDRLVKSGQGDCLDDNMALDNAAYDKAEFDKSLKLAESENGDTAVVVAAFMASKEPHRMQWKLKKVDGQWKIADLLSVTNEWALSQYQCE